MRFGSANKLFADKGLDPSHQISAGKVKGTKARKRNAWLHGELRHERCSATRRLASSRSGRAATWGVTLEEGNPKQSAGWHDGWARHCIIAVSRMNPLMIRATMPC
jgi:hypothetical protein